MTRLVRTPVVPDALAEYRVAPLFSVSLGKLALMSYCSFGVYEWYWFRKQWESERERGDEQINSILRALLAPLYGFNLFRRLRAAAQAGGVPATWPAFSLGLAYLLLSLAWLLPLQPLTYLSALSFAPLLVVQRSVNALNVASAPHVPRNDQFSAAELTLMVIGAALHVLVFMVLRQLDDLMTILQNAA